jgi:hypothetical protein
MTVFVTAKSVEESDGNFTEQYFLTNIHTFGDILQFAL